MGDVLNFPPTSLALTKAPDLWWCYLKASDLCGKMKICARCTGFGQERQLNVNILLLCPEVNELKRHWRSIPLWKSFEYSQTLKRKGCSANKSQIAFL